MIRQVRVGADPTMVVCSKVGKNNYKPIYSSGVEVTFIEEEEDKKPEETTDEDLNFLTSKED